jgi:dihydroorotate dehydrogenase electron transfer subunit
MSPVTSPTECQVEVTANREITPSYFSMRLAGPARLTQFRPGQFLMLRWTDGQDPLLSRAMSIRRVREVQGSRFKVQVVGPQTRKPKPEARIAEVEILYKVCGRGTALLATMRPGTTFRVLGPLGNGFEVSRGARDVVLIAGGIGVPPIAALAEALAARRAARGTKMAVFLGGRSKADLLCVSDLRRAGATVYAATEDGSAGHKGLITEPLEEFLSASHFAPRTKSPRSLLYKRGVGGIYACGPYPMLAAIAPIANQYNLPYQASMEANMACGFGACMGCVVPVKGDERERTYRLVCKDGPVFDGHDILWSNGSIPSIRSTDQTDRI